MSGESRAVARGCPGRGAPGRLRVRAGLAVSLLVCACACGSTRDQLSQPGETAAAGEPVVRLSGTVEAVQTTAISVPRLQGPMTPLLITELVDAGTRVEAGDPIVEFDRQQQERDAFDRRAELSNLVGEIEKKKAEQAALTARDLTELRAAEHDVARAELEVRKNQLIASIDAEKNSLALEQARARYAQLETTFKLKREAEAADLEILEIRRARAERALHYAEGNAELMVVRAPFSGLAVVKRTFRSGQFVEIAEGDEVRPGLPVIDIVDTSRMRVRARVNQADIDAVRLGQAVKVGLDGYPDFVFDGAVELIEPLAATSQFSELVRTFTAVVSIDGTHPQLLPDLTAWVDVPVVPEAATAASRMP
jgi:HlyD family secretion protein